MPPRPYFWWCCSSTIRKNGRWGSAGSRARGTRSTQWESLPNRRPALSTMMAWGMAYSGPFPTVPSGSLQPGTMGTHDAGDGLHRATGATGQSDGISSDTVWSEAGEVVGTEPEELLHQVVVPVEGAGGQNHPALCFNGAVGCFDPHSDDRTGVATEQFDHPGLQHEADRRLLESPPQKLGEQSGAERQLLALGIIAGDRGAAARVGDVLVGGARLEVGARVDLSIHGPSSLRAMGLPVR